MTLDVVLGAGGQRLSRVLDTSTRDYVWLNGQLIAYFDDSATERVRVLTDHIGFPLMVIDSVGATQWDMLHEPYGELIGTFSKQWDPGLRYPGQWQDEVDVEADCDVNGERNMPGPLAGSVSLFENGFRWYRTGWGRYSQTDPMTARSMKPLRPVAGFLWQTGAIPDNAYAYAAGNPLLFVDPLGLVRVANCTCGYVRASGNPGRGRGSGAQVEFLIPPDCTIYGGDNPVPGTDVSDIDFIAGRKFRGT